MARSGILTVLTAILVLFGTVMHAGAATASDLHGWVVVQIEGSVKVKRPTAEWAPLRRGDTVNIGAEVQTGAESKVLLSRDSETITIEPESTLQFLAPTNSSVTRILQKLGGAIFNVRKRDKKKFEVLTPHLVATVKGTEFSVRVDQNGGTIEVIRGRVGILNKASGASVDVSAGQFAIVSAGSGAIATGGTVAGGDSAMLFAVAKIAAALAFMLGIGIILYIGYARHQARRKAASRTGGASTTG